MKLELNKVYRARDGNQWKIVCISQYFQTITCVNNKQDETNLLHLTGLSNNTHGAESDNDLIELIGDDFEPELREFKFVGYLTENRELGPNRYDSIQMALQCFTSILYTNIFLLDGVNVHYDKISKWEITMKELPND